MAICAERSGPGLTCMATIAERADPGAKGKRTAWPGGEPYVILVTLFVYTTSALLAFAPSLSYLFPSS